MDIDPWPEDDEFGHLVTDLSYRNRDVYDAFFAFGEFSTKRAIDSNGVSTKYIFDKTLFNHDVNFVTGIDYYENENDIHGGGSNADDLTISKDEFGIFGYAEYELIDKLYVNGGDRYQKADYQFTQRNVPVDQEQHPDVNVAMGGLRYDYAKGSNIHMNVQQAFRFLATDEWYNSSYFPDFGIFPGLNTDLKQQTGIQYEAGVKHNFDDAVIVSLTPYVLDQKNEIFFDPIGFTNSNYDKTRRYGVDFGQEVDLKKFIEVDCLNKLRIFNNFTYQHAQFRKGPSDGRDIPMVPRYQTSHGIAAGFWKHYQISFVGRYVGARFAVNDTLNATKPAKPYYVLDSKVSFEKDPVKVYVAVNNILNEQYYTYVSKSAFSDNKDYFPAPGRNFLVGVDLKF